VGSVLCGQGIATVRVAQFAPAGICAADARSAMVVVAPARPDEQHWFCVLCTKIASRWGPIHRHGIVRAPGPAIRRRPQRRRAAPAAHRTIAIARRGLLCIICSTGRAQLCDGHISRSSASPEHPDECSDATFAQPELQEATCSLSAGRQGCFGLCWPCSGLRSTGASTHRDRDGAAHHRVQGAVCQSSGTRRPGA